MTVRGDSPLSRHAELVSACSRERRDVSVSAATTPPAPTIIPKQVRDDDLPYAARTSASVTTRFSRALSSAAAPISTARRPSSADTITGPSPRTAALKAWCW